MSLVTSAQPYEFGQSFRNDTKILIGVTLNGGTVVIQQLVNGTWQNTSDSLATNDTYRLEVGGGGVSLRIVCTGAAVVEVP